METWTTTTYQLRGKDDPLPVRHSNNVSLTLPGYCGDGRGFSVHFTPDHLPRLRELIALLEDLLEQEAVRVLTPEDQGDETIPDHVLRRLNAEAPDVF